MVLPSISLRDFAVSALAPQRWLRRSRRKTRRRTRQRQCETATQVLESRALLSVQAISAGLSSPTGVNAGERIQVPVSYQTLDSQGQATSLKSTVLDFNLHFDPNKLTFVGIVGGSEFTEGRVSNPAEVKEEASVSGDDGSNLTTKVLRASFRDNDPLSNPGFPNAGVPSPLQVYIAEFDVSESFSGSTTIAFTANANGNVVGQSASFSFQGTSLTLEEDTVDPPSLAIASTDAAKAEGDSGSTSYTFTVSRSGDTSSPGTVDYAVTGSGASAADASDFIGGALPSGRVDFVAGQTSKEVIIPVAGDTDFESDEGFTVTLSNASDEASITTSTANGTIQNDDAQPQADLEVLSWIVQTPLTVGGEASGRVEVKNVGDATSLAYRIFVFISDDDVLDVNNDRLVLPQPLSRGPVGAGQTDTVRDFVNVPADFAPGNYTVFVVIEDSVGSDAREVASQAVEIVSGARQIVSADDATVTVGGQVQIPVQYSVSSGDNTLGTFGFRLHYKSSELQFDGLTDVFQNFKITEQDAADTLNFDNDLATDRFVLVAWADPTGGNFPNEPLPLTLYDANFTVAAGLNVGDTSTIQFSGSATALGHSFDASPVTVTVQESSVFSITAATTAQDEGDSGTTPFTFTITRSGAIGDAVSVDYSAMGSGSDPADAADFSGGTLPTGTLAFAAGETSKTVELPINGDAVIEKDEQFTVTLSNPTSGGTIDVESASSTVTNDDGPKQIVSASNAAAPAGGRVQIPVQYSVSESDNTLGAFAFRLHYKSSELQFDGLTDVFQNFKITEQDAADTLNFDNDLATDRFVLVAWADPTGDNFPNEPLPLTLYKANFTVNAGLNVGDTSAIQFSRSQTALGHFFKSNPLVVTVLPPVNLDVDNDGTVQVASDGFLILRYMFGFTGTALTDGVLANGAQRTDPGEIIEFLDGGRTSMLDVDDDGTVQVASDGFLILRYMFGFTGTALTDGALGGGAKRTDPEEIVTFLNSFNPGIAASSPVVAGRSVSPSPTPLRPATALPPQSAAVSPTIRNDDQTGTRADELVQNNHPLTSAVVPISSPNRSLAPNTTDNAAVEKNESVDEAFLWSDDDWSLHALFSDGMPAVLDAV